MKDGIVYNTHGRDERRAKTYNGENWKEYTPCMEEVT